MTRSRQRGVALITAVVLVALATVLATAIAFNTAMTARRGAGSVAVEQGLQFALGAEALAAYALREDLTPRTTGATPGAPAPTLRDHPAESWTKPYGPVEISPLVTLEAKLDDEQGKFNLNTLVDDQDRPDEDSIAVFKSLLRLLQLEERWADLMVDWIDLNLDVTPNGGEDNLYTAQQPGYRAANRYITSVSELMQLPEFGRDRYLKLLPYVTALPPQVRAINVCFAQPALLDALASGFTGTTTTSYLTVDPRQFAADRAAGCHPTTQLLGSAVSGPKQAAFLKYVTERTEYFSLHTWVTIGTTRFALYSLLQRGPQGLTVTVQRSFGTE